MSITTNARLVAMAQGKGELAELAQELLDERALYLQTVSEFVKLWAEVCRRVVGDKG